jgi:hypothetical protein
MMIYVSFLSNPVSSLWWIGADSHYGKVVHWARQLYET